MIELKTIRKIQHKGFDIWVQSYLKNKETLFQIKIFDSDGDSITIDNNFVTRMGLEKIAKDYIDKLLIEN